MEYAINMKKTALTATRFVFMLFAFALTIKSDFAVCQPVASATAESFKIAVVMTSGCPDSSTCDTEVQLLDAKNPANASQSVSFRSNGIRPLKTGSFSIKLSTTSKHVVVLGDSASRGGLQIVVLGIQPNLHVLDKFRSYKATLSPSGDKVAYFSHYPRMLPPDVFPTGVLNILDFSQGNMVKGVVFPSANARDQNPNPLVYSEESAQDPITMPAWSPDSKRVSFITRNPVTSNYNLVLISLEDFHNGKEWICEKPIDLGALLEKPREKALWPDRLGLYLKGFAWVSGDVLQATHESFQDQWASPTFVMSASCASYTK